MMSDMAKEFNMKGVGKKMLVPELRFPEFKKDGEWSREKLSNIAKTFSGGTPSVNNRAYYNGDIPFIRSGEIDNDTTELFLTHLGVEKSSAKIVEKGTILYALYGATSGEVAISKIKGAINQAVLAIIPDVKYSTGYIFQFLKKEKAVIVNNFLQGGQGNLSGTIINNLSISFPSYAEQQKIAECLSSIDEEISAIKEKIDQLKEHKKGLMQKLFPIAGKFVPEVRFPEFRKDGAWKEEVLGCCYKLKGGYAFKSSMFQNNGIPIVRISNIPINSLFVDLSDCVYYKEIPNDKTFIINNGDLLLAMSGATTGKTAIYKQNKPAYLNQRVGVFKSIKSTNCYLFLCQWVKTYSYDKQLSSLLTAGAQPNISSNDIETLLFQYPKHLGEQQKIAECLSSIDELIGLYEKKVTLLEQHKKGLMQRLFPKL